MIALLCVVLIILFVLCVKLYIKLTIGRCESPVCLKGKTAIITGANTGIVPIKQKIELFNYNCYSYRNRIYNSFGFCKT